MKKTTNNTKTDNPSHREEDSLRHITQDISVQTKDELAGFNEILKESLQESQLLLKQSQQITPLGTYKLDILSGIWVSSEMLDHIFGIDSDYNKTFESWISIVHPDWRKRMTDYFTNEVLGNKTRFDKEYKIIRQNDHEERWIHGLGDLKFDDHHQPIYMIGTIYDITERKQDDGLLAAVEYTDNIVTVKDLDLRIVAVNQAFLNASGHTSTKSIIGKTDAEVFGISDAVSTYMEDEKRAQKLKPGEFILREEPLRLPDGNMTTILTRKYPIFDSEGNLSCTGNVSTDITVRKKAEEALWLKNIIFDTSIAANSITGIDGIVTEVNEAFLHNMGFQKKDEVIGRPMSYFMNDRNEAQAIEKALKNTGQWVGNYTAKRRDKSTFIAHALAAALHDKNGEIIGYQSSVNDITDLKQAENALRKNEQMLLTVLDHFPGVVFWKDKQSVYLGCNEAFAKGAGLNSPTEIVGKTDFDLPWGEIEAVNYRTDDLNVMEKGKIKLHIIETQHQADGKVSWFDTSKVPLREPGGQVIGVIGVSNDITDRKLAEDALKESEVKYRTVADYTDDWEYWIDLQDNFLYCSPSCKRITGYKATAFIQNPELLFNIIYPADQKIFQIHKQERFVHPNNDELQFRIVRLDGVIIWIGHVCQPVYNESGNCIGFRGSNRDITERKKTEQRLKNSEQKYKLLSENITDGVFISRKGNLEYANKAMSHIFGYDEVDLEGFKLTQLITPELQGDFETFISIDSTSDKVNNIEIECIKKDHTAFYVEFYLKYVANEGVIYGVVHDITEKKQIQERNIVKAIIQTEEKERVNFSKELHDGLGPLLVIIKLYLQWSIRPLSDDSRKDILTKAEDILEEAIMTVKEISYKLSPHLLSYHGLTSAVQSFIHKLEGMNNLKIDFQSNIPERMEMEVEAALYRAIIECINNTIKYAQAQHINIKLDYAKNRINLQYKDDGEGFDIEKTLSGGKGLGLFNLQNRIQTIGGEIKMFSKPSEGVYYQITVPVKQVQTDKS